MRDMGQEQEDYADPDLSPRRSAALRDLVFLGATLAFCVALVFFWRVILG
jgi:hypothetical protein